MKGGASCGEEAQQKLSRPVTIVAARTCPVGCSVASASTTVSQVTWPQEPSVPPSKISPWHLTPPPVTWSCSPILTDEPWRHLDLDGTTWSEQFPTTSAPVRSEVPSWPMTPDRGSIPTFSWNGEGSCCEAPTTETDARPYCGHDDVHRHLRGCCSLCISASKRGGEFGHLERAVFWHSPGRPIGSLHGV